MLWFVADIFYTVHTVYVPIWLDMCQQPTRTQNSVTTDILVTVYVDMFQHVTVFGKISEC
jgi:hypothetical protein